MVYITDIETNKVYCKVAAHSADIPVNMSLCLFTATGFLNAGVYSIKAYDIQSDGTAPQVPLIIGVTITILGSIGSTGSSIPVILSSMCLLPQPD